MSQTEIDRVQQLNTNTELMEAQRQTMRSLLAQRTWLINMVQSLRGVVRKDMERLVAACGKESVRNQVEWNNEWHEVLSANYPGPVFPDLVEMATELNVNHNISLIRWASDNCWVIGHVDRGAWCTDGWATGNVLKFPYAESALSWICNQHPEWLVPAEKVHSATSKDGLTTSEAGA